MIRLIEEPVHNQEVSPLSESGNPCSGSCTKPYPEGCKAPGLMNWIATVMWENQPGI